MNKEVNNVIVLKQTPIIEYSKLEEISKEVDKKLEFLKKGDLVVTEENKVEIKKLRTEISNDFKVYETARKQIKEAVNNPYDEFNKKYVELIANKFKEADKTLKAKIEAIEDAQKKEKETKARDYFKELIIARKIDFVTFEQVGLNISLSLSDKKAKDTINAFVERIVSDLALIDTQDNKERILTRYQQSLDVSGAIQTVKAEIEHEEKIKRANEERERLAQEAKAQAEAKKQEEAPLAAPTAARPVEVPKVAVEVETIKAQFTVTGTKQQIIDLRNYMDERGIKYE